MGAKMTYELKSIEFSENKWGAAVAVLFYRSSDVIRGDKKNHCEIMKLSSVERITLNEKSFTLHWNQNRLKLYLNDNIDLETVVKLIDNITGSGLKMVEHLTNFMDIKNIQKKET